MKVVGHRKVCVPLPCLALLLWSACAVAHPLAPGLLQLEELGAGRYAVIWKVPSSSFDTERLVPQLPAACRDLVSPTTTDVGTAFVTSSIVDCGPAGLAGTTLQVLGLEQSSVDVLLSVIPARGATVHAVLSASAASYALPAASSLPAVLRGYAALGVHHILTGYDHLLFVVALTLLVASRRELLIAVTGFTLGHSLTLSLATLNLVQVPAAPIEALIAASIVVLAAEVAAHRPCQTLPTRAPWLVTTLFGFLHGLGFAGALREIGLPQDATVPALAAFNLGVELGQLGIVAVCLAVRALLRRVPATAPLRDGRLVAYPIGLLAAFWTCQRVVLALHAT
jgi:hydrogenase/urease accessory protein HupE